jgi:hypothetical protein
MSSPSQKIFFSLSERRPLKSTMPLFQSPSSRLNPKDIMEDDRGCSVDGLNLTSSLEGSHNEALHYSFMPNKQIVSLSFSFCFTFSGAMLCHLTEIHCQSGPGCAFQDDSLHSLSSKTFIFMNSAFKIR